MKTTVISAYTTNLKPNATHEAKKIGLAMLRAERPANKG